MPKLKVMVTDHIFETFEIEQNALKEIDAELVVKQCKTADEMRQAVEAEQPDALLNTYLSGVDKSVMQTSKNLKAVVRYGIGLDTINIPEATELGIIVANVPDYCINEVADHAMALFLCVARKVVLSDAKVKSGQWSLSYVKPLKAIQDMQVGIIGFGRIGRAIAGRIEGFNVKAITFYDPLMDDDTGNFKAVSLDELIAQSDAIFVQCPATEENNHLLNAERFSQMKNQPLIINAARGALIDTKALVEAMKAGKVAGAALDVLDDESLIETDLLKDVPNLVITPHSAWFSSRAIGSLRAKAIDAVVTILKGQSPQFAANPEVLKK